ncbi:MAG: type 2 lanthipeptide synthetase LanM family protein [Cyanobacteria bacterium J06635_15]
MAKTFIATSDKFTDTELSSIVADASFLWERLNPDHVIVDSEQIEPSEITRRCDRWVQTVAHENRLEILQKRLHWEDLSLDDIRPYLGKVNLVQGQTLPLWAKTLRQIMRTAAEFESNTKTAWPTMPDKPITFEDVWLPAIQVARQKVLRYLGTTQLTIEALPLSILSENAYLSLERSLLRRLAQLSTKTLDFEFSKVRPFGQNLLNLFGIEANTGHQRTQYTQFVNDLRQDGLLRFFQKYPVLGRLIATAVEFWVEATVEFIQRLAHDYLKLQQVFGTTSSGISSTRDYLPLKNFQEQFSSDRVADIDTSLSDPHNQGRTVILLTFESGLKLVYKPKDLSLEVAWNQFLDWCNRQHQMLDLKVIQVLNCDGYGWVEYVEHLTCADKAEAARFYQRAGMLLCLIYVLRGTDCHHENLIAHGEHLVLIDMETLLHHETHPIDNSPDAQRMGADSVQLFGNSVLRTGLLPRWDFGADQRIAYDISGLGSIDPQQAPRKMQRWQAINTDNMHLRLEAVTLPVEKNVPFLGDSPLSPNDYQAHIMEGFDQMYQFLKQRQRQLLAKDGPLAVLQHQQVRFIFRATHIYFTILQKAWMPDYLRNGADYSIELEHLSRAFMVAQEKPDAWPILKGELRAMEQLDIPFFTADTNGDTLVLKNIQTVPKYFKQASYQQVVDQLQTLNKTDLAQQMTIVQGAFHARVAQSSTGKSQPWQTDTLPLLSVEQLIQAALAIATDLEARALQDLDGSLNWIGMGFSPQANRFQLQVLNDSLYDGRCGISLFLAGLYQVTQMSHYQDLSWAVLQPLRRQLRSMNTESRQRYARLMGLGGATGVGSLLYTFVKVSQFLKDETLLFEAQLLANQLTPALIAADNDFDITGGAAGAIPGLLALYEATGEVTVLEKAIACGNHLLNHQMNTLRHPKAWQTLAEKPLTGFSHGAAGIAYALLKLYAVTNDLRYQASAQEGIEYERSVFSESEANWPDLRSSKPTGARGFPVQWCHGAAGIGLGRLGSLEILKTIEIEQDIQIALQTTQQHGLKDIDHLCCGNLGLAEVLLVGAQRCDGVASLVENRLDWRQAALQKATSVVARAKQSGAYQLFPNLPTSVFNPGFFQGVAGIGYVFLRLAHPDLPCVLLWE